MSGQGRVACESCLTAMPQPVVDVVYVTTKMRPAIASDPLPALLLKFFGIAWMQAGRRAATRPRSRRKNLCLDGR